MDGLVLLVRGTPNPNVPEAYPFVFFAAMMVVQFVVVLFFFPETKQVSLEELQKRLKIV